MKTNIDAWIDNVSISPRLRNSLIRFQRKYPVRYVEDVEKDDFLSCKGVGLIQWREFDRARGSNQESANTT